MGSSVVAANAGTAYSFWSQAAAKGSTTLSTAITGGDTNWNAQTRDSTLWAKRILCQADPAGGPIRYRYDGGAPSGTAGHILTGGDSLILDGYANIRNFQIASNAVTAGILNVTAER